MEIGAGPYLKPYERDSASVQAAEVAESAADAATAVVSAKMTGWDTEEQQYNGATRLSLVTGGEKRTG